MPVSNAMTALTVFAHLTDIACDTTKGNGMS
jgi:hypothetical protein